MDESVEFSIKNLKKFVLYNANLVASGKNELSHMNRELDELTAIVMDASKTYKKDQVFKAWEKQIKEVVYEIEDTIDTCLTNIADDKAKKGSHLLRFKSTPITMAKTVKMIRENKLQPLLNPETHNFAVADDMDIATDNTIADAREIRQKKTKNVVGFTEETKEFLCFLNEKTSKLEVTSIVGMAGLGKTTLAWKIFDDPIIKNEFPVRIWVNVSDSLKMQNVLRTILLHFTAENPPKSYEDLLKTVMGRLKQGKILIVLDDIWTTKAWEKIKEILPSENNKCKILVTTRNKDVAEAATSITRPPHYLRFQTAAESWELLQHVVYGNLKDVPHELEDVGKFIARDCDGLPLSIVVIGGILLEKILEAGKNLSDIEEDWCEISRNVKSYLVDGDKMKLLSSIISLSYEKIPYELRNCFMYLGVYPEDADIPVNELIRLWIAEGFIQEKDGKSMEQVALENLNDFINRNLVMVKEAKLDGEPKICHISNAVREICRTEAKYGNLNLFQEITRSEGGIFEPCVNVENFRRICIHSYVANFFKQNYKVQNARSFLCFYPSTISLPPKKMGLVSNGFSLLRVYNAKTIRFPNFPREFLQLHHLRYLTLVMEHCATLPESISELLHLQTLIVVVPSYTLDVKADIWMLRQLRHLKTKAAITLRGDTKGEGGENLQILSRLSPESCTNKVFKKLRNLISLGIQGELDKHCWSFSNHLSSLDGLQKLKLVNQVPNGETAESPLRRLPESGNFPPNLKILVLNGTYMQWLKMSVLSELGSLKVLKLKENTFTGNTWEAEYVFHHLESLHIERMTELVHWKAYKCPFPKLKSLLLNSCEKLVEVPSGVCENLETLYMERVTKEAVISAEAIANCKQENGVFKLEIHPADRIHKPADFDYNG